MQDFYHRKPIMLLYASMLLVNVAMGNLSAFNLQAGNASIFLSFAVLWALVAHVEAGCARADS